MASLAGDDVSFATLGDLIEKDTVVAANILRVVNSAVYARRGSVNSVRHALSVLGIDKVRNTVLAMSISRMLNQAKTPDGWSMERFNRHAAAVAMLSDMIAQRAKVEYPEGAFIGGLLHDIGRLLIAMGLTHSYDEILKLYNESGRPWIDCEKDVLGFDHADLSADALHEWKLPEEIRDAVQNHHLPVERTGVLPLSQVLWAANEVIDALGISIEKNSPTEGDADQVIVQALTTLGLNAEAQVALMEQFQAEHAAVSQFYQ